MEQNKLEVDHTSAKEELIKFLLRYACAAWLSHSEAMR